MFYAPKDNEAYVGALLVGVSKADLLSGNHTIPAYMTISDFDPVRCFPFHQSRARVCVLNRMIIDIMMMTA